MDSDVVTFAQWCKEKGLTEETLDVLNKEEISSFTVLESLQTEDIEALHLSLGQRAVLRRAASSLHDAQLNSASDTNSASAKITPKALEKNEELNQLLDQLKNTHLTDLLHNDNNAEVGQVKQGQCPGEITKPLFIHDYLSSIKGNSITDDDDEDTFTMPGGKQLIFKSKRKINPEQVSTAQYLSATARILTELVEKSSNVETPQLVKMVKEYLQYQVLIGDLLQQYTTQSVMILDYQHRKEYSKDTSKPMSDIDLNNLFLHLEKRNQINGNTRNKDTPSRRKRNNAGREICIKFNNRGGCNYGESCRFVHECLVDGCYAKHPQYEHSKNTPLPPRFRAQSNEPK